MTPPRLPDNDPYFCGQHSAIEARLVANRERIEQVREELKSDIGGISTPVSTYAQMETENRMKMSEISAKQCQMSEVMRAVSDESDKAVAAANAACLKAEGAVVDGKETRRWIYTLLASVILLGVGKIYQDYSNQNQTATYLRDLSSTIAVLKDHDASFQQHIKQSVDEMRASGKKLAGQVNRTGEGKP